MKYEILFPSTYPGMYGPVFRQTEAEPCFICNSPTYFTDLRLGVAVCSEKCHKNAKIEAHIP